MSRLFRPSLFFSSATCKKKSRTPCQHIDACRRRGAQYTHFECVCTRHTFNAALWQSYFVGVSNQLAHWLLCLWLQLSEACVILRQSLLRDHERMTRIGHTYSLDTSIVSKCSVRNHAHEQDHTTVEKTTTRRTGTDMFHWRLLKKAVLKYPSHYNKKNKRTISITAIRATWPHHEK